MRISIFSNYYLYTKAEHHPYELFEASNSVYQRPCNMLAAIDAHDAWSANIVVDEDNIAIAAQ